MNANDVQNFLLKYPFHPTEKSRYFWVAWAINLAIWIGLLVLAISCLKK